MNSDIERARSAWENLSGLRERRRRCKRQVFGGGMREGIRNNLTRQLLKSIIGRYMHLRGCKVGETGNDARLGKDARALEEFLISATVYQRISDRGEIENISPERVLFERFEKGDGKDCRYFGMLHDMGGGEMLRRFSHGDPVRAGEIMALIGRESCGELEPGMDVELIFDGDCGRGKVRVVEIWQRRSDNILRCHDPLRGEYGECAWSEAALGELSRLNAERRARKVAEVRILADVRDVWEELWITPDGVTLERKVHRDPGAFPFVMCLYPFIDGEVHSLVEDVMPQQELVDRMVGLLDTVIANSAKGVLLFPADQLPEGFTWKDMRRIWSDPGGIIPYRRTSRTTMPQQISSSGWATGAADMLKIQLDLFEQVAGVSGSLRGKEMSVARGAEAVATHTENTTVGMLDLLAAFHNFVERRERKEEREERKRRERSEKNAD